jgi:peptide deformylase
MDTAIKPQKLPIVLFPDSKLYEVSRPVDFNVYQTTPVRDRQTSLLPIEREQLAVDLVETMNASRGVGLSAIQVGRALRVFAVKDGERDLVLFNPVWSPTEDARKVWVNEGCLSFPQVFEDVERYDKVTVAWVDAKGADFSSTFEGTAAQVIQHETEHLDGHLFIEHLPTHKRDKVRTKMKQRARLTARIGRMLGTNGTPDLKALAEAGLVRVVRDGSQP